MAETIKNKYPLLLECYRSGQIPEREWCELQRDEVFRAWLKKQALR